jgi:hypothetical protein
MGSLEKMGILNLDEHLAEGKDRHSLYKDTCFAGCRSPHRPYPFQQFEEPSIPQQVPLCVELSLVSLLTGLVSTGVKTKAITIENCENRHRQ